MESPYRFAIVGAIGALVMASYGSASCAPPSADASSSSTREPPLVISPISTKAAPTTSDASTTVDAQTTPAPVKLVVIVKKPSIKTGRYPIEDIETTLRQGEAALERCYRTATSGGGVVSGDVSLSFLIGTTGDVNTVLDHGSSVSDPALVGCARRAVYALDFPAHGSSAIVEVSIEFALAPP